MKNFSRTELATIVCALVDYRNHAEEQARAAKPEYLWESERHNEAATRAQKLIDIFGKRIDALNTEGGSMV